MSGRSDKGAAAFVLRVGADEDDRTGGIAEFLRGGDGGAGVALAFALVEMDKVGDRGIVSAVICRIRPVRRG
ncbi:MAG TPA: hypothetical protein VEV84_05385 [Pyrinomonadaceae bacterium]|nr:hypothetical protein [Pyrinomonadaceae bacterium]